jgi:hypothetical protein
VRTRMSSLGMCVGLIGRRHIEEVGLIGVSNLE